MNISQKIYLNDDNKDFNRYIKVKLEQDIESIEFLSLRVNSNDIYQSFNADYGVLVGRVIANNGIGVPNAKISIFIPLTDDDVYNEDIAYIYPYKTPRDKNNEGKRYNLLPRVGKVDSSTGISRPQQPFGTFPIKEEIVMNQKHLDVYKKYYKYTALTNQYGDYMIFGTPIGTQTIHMSLDITDIGQYSMTPASMVTNLGYSEKLFTNNNTRIKSSDDLNDLPNIETQDITVDIIPFWGDVSTYEIGITRQDFRVRTTINNTFTIFGNAFTDGIESMWGAPTNNNTITPHELYYIGDVNDLNITTKRGVMINETVYYYPSEISDEDIDLENVNESDMRILDKTEYSKYAESDGRFVYIISCNRKKQIINEENIATDVPYDYNGGIFTEFRGFIVFETDSMITKMNAVKYLGDGDRGRVEPFRYKLKVPQRNYRVTGTTANSGIGGILDSEIGGSFIKDDANTHTIQWKKDYHKFTGGKIYSVSRFHGLVCNTENQTNVDIDPIDGMLNKDVANDINNSSCGTNYPNFSVGIIESPLSGITDNFYVLTGYTGTIWSGINVSIPQKVFPVSGNTLSSGSTVLTGYTVENNTSVTILVGIDLITSGDKSKSIPPNSTDGNYFGAEWLNFSLYFPQIGELINNIRNNDDVKSSSHFTKDVKDRSFYYENNEQEIAASNYNTKYFGRSDINKTGFIEVSKEDINAFMSETNNGFKKLNTEVNSVYKNENSTISYFYKGFGVDCIQYLKDVGIV